MATPDGEVVFPLGRANENSSSNPSFPPLTEPSGYLQGPHHCTNGTNALMNRHQRRKLVELLNLFIQ